MTRGGAVYIFMSEGQRSRSPGVKKYLTAMIPYMGKERLLYLWAKKDNSIISVNAYSTLLLSTPIHKTILITTQYTLYIMYFRKIGQGNFI